jgi:hypothetical protein
MAKASQTSGGNSTALTVIKREEFPLAVDSQLAQVLAENFRGETIGEDLLTKIKVPAAGSPFWMIDEKPEQDFIGVVIRVSTKRRMWPSKDVTGEPPACSSEDGLIGIGMPGGDCVKCPQSQRGGMCRESRLLLVMRPGAAAPDVVQVPRTSIRTWKDYMKKLSFTYKQPFSRVVTQFGLTPDKSKEKGYDFLRISFTPVGLVSSETAQEIIAVAKAFEEAFAAVRVDGDDAGSVETEEV